MNDCILCGKTDADDGVCGDCRRVYRARSGVDPYTGATNSECIEYTHLKRTSLLQSDSQGSSEVLGSFERDLLNMLQEFAGV